MAAPQVSSGWGETTRVAKVQLSPGRELLEAKVP